MPKMATKTSCSIPFNKRRYRFVSELLDWASPRGWDIEIIRNHRVKWRYKNGGFVYSATVCRDPHGRENVKSQMRRTEMNARALNHAHTSSAPAV